MKNRIVPAVIICVTLLLLFCLILYYPAIKNFLPSIATIILLTGIVSAGWIFLSWNTLRKIIRIWRTKTYWIISLPSDGKVKVIGTAGGQSLISPINKTPCVAWKVEVNRHVHKSKSEHWETILKKTSTYNFSIADGTGKVWIQPDEAELINVRGKTISELDNHTLEALKSLGVQLKNEDVFTKELVIDERCIVPETQVFVIGTVPAPRLISAQVISDQGENDVQRALYQKLMYGLLKVGLTLISFILGYLLIMMKSGGH